MTGKDIAMLSKQNKLVMTWYGWVERVFVLASPIVFLIGWVFVFFHVPIALLWMSIVASIDVVFFSIRFSFHALWSFLHNHYIKGVLFAILGLPMIAFVIYSSAVAGNAINTSLLVSIPSFWLQFGIVSLCFVLSIAFYRWYWTGKAFDY
jgi:hypothetical protein